MKFAVCLLTADRARYTAATCASYVEHANPPPGTIHLHADDGSVGRDNEQIAEAAGFETIYIAAERRGALAALKVMWREAAIRGATHILHLENDNEFVRSVPWHRATECESLRLYGKLKSRTGDRAKVGENIIGTQVAILWTPYQMSGEYEKGVAHWGGLPSITRADLLLRAVNQADRFKDIPYGLTRLATLRTITNVTWHIGDERTPNARFGE